MDGRNTEITSPAPREAMAGLSRYARVLDASVGIPGTRWRLGVDSIIGLVPGIGDWIGVGLSGWILYRGHRLGVRRRTMARMLVNVGLEGTVGAIPVLGDLFDIWFRANQRNVALIERDLEKSARKGRRITVEPASSEPASPAEPLPSPHLPKDEPPPPPPVSTRDACPTLRTPEPELPPPQAPVEGRPEHSPPD